jgi:Na+/proline symporter
MDLTAYVILGYLLFFIAVGVYISRGNKSSSDWAIGGGTLGVGIKLLGDTSNFEHSNLYSMTWFNQG